MIPSFSILIFLETREVDTGRVGVRYSPTPNSDLLFSYIRSDVLDDVNFAPGFPFQTNLQGSQFESQYIYRGEWLNLVAGGGDTSVNELLGSVELPLIPGEFGSRTVTLHQRKASPAGYVDIRL